MFKRRCNVLKVDRFSPRVWRKAISWNWGRYILADAEDNLHVSCWWRSILAEVAEKICCVVKVDRILPTVWKKYQCLLGKFSFRETFNEIFDLFLSLSRTLWGGLNYQTVRWGEREWKIYSTQHTNTVRNWKLLVYEKMSSCLIVRSLEYVRLQVLSDINLTKKPILRSIVIFLLGCCFFFIFLFPVLSFIVSQSSLLLIS